MTAAATPKESARVRTRWGATLGAVAVVVSATLLLIAAVPAHYHSHTPKGMISAVGAESQYANVLAQLGGRYVTVSSVLTNPNVDPHAFEASPTIAEQVSRAQIVVQNGVGYDSFMNDIEAASPNPARKVVVAQRVLGLSSATANPHLWYSPRTMPAVATVVTADLCAIDPSHAPYFRARLHSFEASLTPWRDAIRAFRIAHRGLPVATTEPVADYLLSAMGLRVLTPFTFQSDVMNGIDPSPEDVTIENHLLSAHRVKVFFYNHQVVDSLTASILANARAAAIPVVGVYETMPTPGYDYQSWMSAEVAAITRAVVHGVSTEHL